MKDSQSLMTDVLTWANLCEAWQQVEAAKSAPGVDEVTVKRWARNWETNLTRLQEQVSTNTYHPNRPRRFKVLKKDGTDRELSILTVTDRVLQRAVLNVVDKLFEARFLPCSHGYRQNRSTATAVQQVLNWRDRGRGWVLDADISACFESLNHALLLDLVGRVMKDTAVLNLMQLWLTVGARRSGSTQSTRSVGVPPLATGVPMGAVLSPLWCNVYLHQLDARLSCAGWQLVRYADDFVVMTETREEAEAALAATEAALARLKLVLAPHKTRILSFEAGFEFLGVTFYRNTYSYTWEQKQVVVEGRNPRWLFKHIPQFY